MFAKEQEMGSTNNYSNPCALLVEENSSKDGKISQVLAIAVGVWLVLTLVFLALRYLASDYSRAALATSSQYVQSVSSHSKLVDEQKDRSLSLSTLVYEDKHWYTWFFNFFYRLRSSDIRHRCGPDATLYLSLHAHIILLLCLLSFISLVIILPVNYFGGHLESEIGGFLRTTISNLDPRSGVLWVHTIFSLVYLGITAVFMIHYSLQLGKQQLDYSNHGVMVQWIPSVVHREDILQHLQEALPDSPVADVQMAYDVDRLVSLRKQLTGVTDKIAEVESIRSELRVEETVRVGWRKLCCCVSTYNLDAKSYYDILYNDLRKSIKKEGENVKMNKKLGIGFITFSMEKDAKDFIDSYKLFHTKPRSSVYNDVGARWWWVSSAPYPLDIIWENLSMPYMVWWIRWLLINIVLVVFVFFFTTPTILLSSIDELRVIFTNYTHIPDITQLNTTYSDPLVKVLLPNLLLLFFASLLPFLVSRSSYLEAHWTKSFREQTIMRKIYLFLFLMVIILPAIGLSSLSALAELVTQKKFGAVLQGQLSCVFLPSNGAFFVGYVINAAFIGTSVKLLRIPELILYMIKRLRAKTRLQKELALKKAAVYEFMYGVEYAWNLVIFNMVVSFSLTVPIIVPFGVVYFILNYFTDRYNIYYVYKAAPYNGRQFLHRSAVNFVIVGAVTLQVLILFFSLLRLGQVDPRTVIMMVTLAITCVICVGVMFFGWFKHFIILIARRLGKEYDIFKNIQGKNILSMSEESEETGEFMAKGSYIPPVLRESSQIDTPSSTDHSLSGFGYQSFGSTDRMGRKSASNTPTALSPTPHQAESTLERSAFKSKPSGGGGASAGSNTSVKKYETVAIKDQEQPKSFV